MTTHPRHLDQPEHLDGTHNLDEPERTFQSDEPIDPADMPVRQYDAPEYPAEQHPAADDQAERYRADRSDMPASQHHDDPGIGPVLSARHLIASGPRGTVFGPLDLDLMPGELCLVHGDAGSGKSSLLLALTARFRKVSGALEIAGIDAMADPYAAMAEASVARLGEYVVPEDRLTVGESIAERAFQDGISVREARQRAAEIEEYLGYRVERDIEMQDLDPVVRSVVTCALAMLRPTHIVAIDDVDLVVPHSLQPTMFEALHKLATFGRCAIIATAIDADTAPAGSLRIRLAGRTAPHAHPIDASDAVERVESDPEVAPPLDDDELQPTRVGAEHEEEEGADR
ncbi:MAG: ATP-binding cassette domain-containing protein [Flaviflexus sp.]|nr:ATP-binding cassette domain-containing protein [Flaviflexus sp.]